MIGFYAQPFALDSNGSLLSNVYDPSQTSFYYGTVAGLGYETTTVLDAGPNYFGTGYEWIITIPLQENTNGNPGGVTLLIYTNSIGGGGP